MRKALLVLVVAAGCTTPPSMTCEPTACNLRCGFVDDGCGNTIACGPCVQPTMDAGTQVADAGTELDAGLDAGVEVDAGFDAGTTIDDAGTTIDAGLACAYGCPMGATCDTSSGTCINAPNPIVIDVKPWTVSGHLLARGATPTTGPACNMGDYDVATIRFTEVSRPMQLVKDVRVRCSDNFAFSVELVEGRYHVGLETTGFTDRNDLPYVHGGAPGILDVRSDVPNFVIDVNPQLVTGSLTFNGATPQITGTCSSSSSKAVLWFEHEGGFSQQYDMRCTQTGWGFSVPLLPGQYVVRVVAYDGVTNLPTLVSGHVTADGTLDVRGPRSNVTLNVTGYVVSGRVLLDGQPLVSTCTGIYSRVSVEVWDGETILRIVDIPCSRPTDDFSMTVPPGKYWLRPSDIGHRTNLPTTPTPGLKFVPLDVQGPMSNVLVDFARVQATVSLHKAGAMVTAPTSCTGSLNFRFTPLDDRGAFASVNMPCTTTNWTMPTTLVAGAYAVEVTVPAGLGVLPEGAVNLSDRIVVSAQNTNLVFDVDVTQLNAMVLLNGGSPCTPGLVRIELASRSGSRSLNATCNAGLATFSGPVLTGHYSSVNVAMLNLSTSAVVQRDVTFAPGPVTRTFDALVPHRDVQVLRHGVTPLINPTSCNTPNLIHLSVRFREVTGRYSDSQWFGTHVVCSDTSFVLRDIAIPEGIYSVELDSDGQSNLPYAQWMAIERLALP